MTRPVAPCPVSRAGEYVHIRCRDDPGSRARGPASRTERRRPRCEAGRGSAGDPAMSRSPTRPARQRSPPQSASRRPQIRRSRSPAVGRAIVPVRHSRTTRPAIRTRAIPRASVAIRNGWKTVTRTLCFISMAIPGRAEPDQDDGKRNHQPEPRRRPGFWSHLAIRRWLRSVALRTAMIRDRHRCEREVAAACKPLRHPPQMREHVLGALKLHAQEPEKIIGHVAHERRTAPQVHREPGQHGHR